MQQAYGRVFARVYNKKWIAFSNSVAPVIEAFFRSRPSFDRLPKTLLDLCCGSGQLMNYFLNRGYAAHGVDLSPHMIEIARDNNKEYGSSGMATFSIQDASDFRHESPVSYAVCTFDAMNHLDSLQAVATCCRRTYDVLASQGVFVFDINTRKGLHRWNGMSIQEDEDVFILNRGIYDDTMDRAYTQITGFLRGNDGKYERFNETAFNTVLPVRRVLDTLADIGYRAYCASYEQLAAPVTDPESMGRVCIVCEKT